MQGEVGVKIYHLELKKLENLSLEAFVKQVNANFSLIAHTTKCMTQRVKYGNC